MVPGPEHSRVSERRVPRDQASEGVPQQMHLAGVPRHGGRDREKVGGELVEGVASLAGSRC